MDGVSLPFLILQIFDNIEDQAQVHVDALGVLTFWSYALSGSFGQFRLKGLRLRAALKMP
ncbi:hypothetical protein [Agrobacterium vitis]|uniref:hypothetical protein n=1 Tax=Agrobacterium vitis TaxID=373 RepID=UPI0012E8CE38|nr:hypothetical protein [Agrobacterium vitis]MVA53231.1 hypothetical protein [Agrobacterium vitis]MVA73804.1 hypothetical protein [Agrobacterium vitis]NSZ51830.1 hypothetical protein [Agrobacterium vitis]NTA30589.1 hypothetical protein [Agrobacterium vitis]